ncbi:hypothetical protein PanWU01x14_166890 [Parasponia andersonii]|uniref:Uncharacterized protein n=1 Tax=Parasponia andersonii TaxID=3476 RepID=A0A2P5CBS2_PARAD|nr:hypothetical protein PanWU01x14_166890 [Parasponia andersonii]
MELRYHPDDSAVNPKTFQLQIRSNAHLMEQLCKCGPVLKFIELVLEDTSMNCRIYYEFMVLKSYQMRGEIGFCIEDHLLPDSLYRTLDDVKLRYKSSQVQSFANVYGKITVDSTC